MARRRRKSARGSGAAVIVGITAIAALIIVAVAAFSYYKWIASHKVALDPHTNCPVTGPVSATAVLLDVSVCYFSGDTGRFAQQVRYIGSWRTARWPN